MARLSDKRPCRYTIKNSFAGYQAIVHEIFEI